MSAVSKLYLHFSYIFRGPERSSPWSQAVQLWWRRRSRLDRSPPLWRLHRLQGETATLVSLQERLRHRNKNTIKPVLDILLIYQVDIIWWDQGINKTRLLLWSNVQWQPANRYYYLQHTRNIYKAVCLLITLWDRCGAWEQISLKEWLKFQLKGKQLSNMWLRFKDV